MEKFRSFTRFFKENKVVRINVRYQYHVEKKRNATTILMDDKGYNILRPIEVDSENYSESVTSFTKLEYEVNIYLNEQLVPEGLAITLNHRFTNATLKIKRHNCLSIFIPRIFELQSFSEKSDNLLESTCVS
jgi:hypothetical protein